MKFIRGNPNFPGNSETIVIVNLEWQLSKHYYAVIIIIRNSNNSIPKLNNDLGT